MSGDDLAELCKATAYAQGYEAQATYARTRDRRYLLNPYGIETVAHLSLFAAWSAGWNEGARLRQWRAAHGR